MPIGSRRSRGEEYVFIDGRAVPASQATPVAPVPGQSQASVPGQQEAAPSGKPARVLGAGGKPFGRSGTPSPEEDQSSVSSPVRSTLTVQETDQLLRDEKRAMRRKYLAFGLVLLALTLFSLCISDSYYGRIYSPVDVIQCYGAWFQVAGAQLFDPIQADRVYFAVLERLPMYNDVIYTFLSVFKYLSCGVLLAVSGMLYQNSFRNPIAAPSMLGVTNGVNAAILILVLQFGYNSLQMMGYYYLYCYIGGTLILILVLLGGKYMSGKGNFNVVNMLLIGTIVSQLLGVIVTYAQNMVLDETAWDAFYKLQTATGLDTGYTYATLLAGLIIGMVPVIAMRFRLNLVSFDDAETRLLGVNANRLRVIALVCGSIMILTAQVNAGQVAMASLVVPYVVRAVFGAEFRKQLVGNVLVGALILLIAGDIVSFIAISEVSMDIGSVVTICAMPLFVWMVARGARSWE